MLVNPLALNNDLPWSLAQRGLTKYNHVFVSQVWGGFELSFLKLLFGKKETRRAQINPDVIWFSRQAKYDGIRAHLQRDSLLQCAAILLVAHSKDTLEQLQQIAEAYDGDIPVMSLMAGDLSSDVANRLQIGEDKVIELVIAERHPLTYIDDHVIDGFAELLACRCNATCYLSLDDELVREFGGDRAKEIMSKMGMKDDETIESKMVSRRIRASQKKLTKLAEQTNSKQHVEDRIREGDWESAFKDLL